MHNTKFSIVLVAITLLVLAVSASAGPITGPVMGYWRDINPSAYLSPPSNPPLNSIYMLSPNEGWAVGDSRPSTEANTTITSNTDVDVKIPVTTTTIVSSTTSTNAGTFTLSSTLTSTSFRTSTSRNSTSTGTGSIASAKILYWDGSTWNLVPAPPFLNPLKPSAYNLTSVTFGPPTSPISRTDGWAVGCTFDPASVAIHWDGVSWSVQRAGLIGPDAGCLESAFMVSSTDTWAVGSNAAGTAGVFWHWSGTAGLGGGWNEPQVPVSTLFNSVFMVSPSEGWAVGDCVNAGCPPGSSNIYHYFGGTWTAFPSPVTTSLHSIYMLSPTEGWAVGDSGVILHYTTGIWTGPVSPGTTSNALLSVFMVSGTEGWAQGIEGNILHYSGGTWTKLPINLVPTSPTTSFDFHSVFLLDAADGWGVGSADVILHWDGVNWGTLTSPTLNTLRSISFGPPLSSVNPNDGWAVGDSGTGTDGTTEPTIIHWNGFMWTRGVAIGTANGLKSAYMLNIGDVWAVGGGGSSTATCSTAPCPVILHFTGGSWNTVTPPPGSYILNSVFMVSQSEGWAVGCSGTMNQCNDTAEAKPHPTGGSGIILHYTVTGGVGTWATFPSPSTPPLNSVFMVNANEGWIVGDGTDFTSATILHYTVTGGLGTWNAVVAAGLPTGSNLNSVFMLSSTSGWAVGGITQPECPAWVDPGGECTPTFFAAGPIIIYWDGAKWSKVTTPELPGGGKPVLLSTYFTGANDGWAVGTPGILVPTIFHWDGVRWMPITLSPALLGAAPPTIPPTLKSVYMIDPSTGWIVGSPVDFSHTPIFYTKPLASILRFASYGGVVGATSTSLVVSTISTTTTAIITSLSTLISGTSVTTTSTSTSSVTGGGIPGFPIESIIAGIAVGLLTLMVLRRRRAKGPEG
jgi:photosystem II stability/assembly factor-like uncharacterized protein